MDIGPAILIFYPILLPIMAKLAGVDPVHFRHYHDLLTLAIGTITRRQLAVVLYVGASVGKVKVEEVIKPFAAFLRRDYRRSVINYLHSGGSHCSYPSTGHRKRIVSCIVGRMAIRVLSGQRTIIIIHRYHGKKTDTYIK